jgi:hypothetical protein
VGRRSRRHRRCCRRARSCPERISCRAPCRSCRQQRPGSMVAPGLRTLRCRTSPRCTFPEAVRTRRRPTRTGPTRSTHLPRSCCPNSSSAPGRRTGHRRRSCRRCRSAGFHPFRHRRFHQRRRSRPGRRRCSRRPRRHFRCRGRPRFRRHRRYRQRRHRRPRRHGRHFRRHFRRCRSRRRRHCRRRRRSRRRRHRRRRRPNRRPRPRPSTGFASRSRPVRLRAAESGRRCALPSRLPSGSLPAPSSRCHQSPRKAQYWGARVDCRARRSVISRKTTQPSKMVILLAPMRDQTDTTRLQ